MLAGSATQVAAKMRPKYLTLKAEHTDGLIRVKQGRECWPGRHPDRGCPGYNAAVIVDTQG
jgi:hypothetical protein